MARCVPETEKRGNILFIQEILGCNLKYLKYLSENKCAFNVHMMYNTCYGMRNREGEKYESKRSA
jgi:hypothetical protein